MARKFTNKTPTGKTLPAVNKGLTKIKDIKFVKAYIENGGNSTQAYKSAKPNVKLNSAGTEGYRMLQKPEIRRGIEVALEEAGVTDTLISYRVKDLLHSRDAWSVNEGIKHSRAIKGLDAERRSHLTVDKREVSIKLDATEARDLFVGLLSKSKSRRKRNTS